MGPPLDEPASALDANRVIEGGRLSRFQVRVMLLCMLVAMLDGFDIQAMAFVAPVIAGDWGLHVQALGPALAASLVGLAVGTAVLGPLGDRWGRRPVILWSFAAAGLCSALTATSGSLITLVMWRFITGVALGGSIPNAMTLTAEYVPARTRTFMVTLMFCGFPLGAALGGAFVGPVVGVLGWQGVFGLGGALPLLLCLFLWRLLPESIAYLAGRKDGVAKAAALLARVTGRPTDAALMTPAVPSARVATGALAVLREGRAASTLALWAIFFGNLFMLYFLLSWLPTFLTRAGMPLETATRYAALFNLGGVLGGLILSLVMDRIGPTRLLVAAYLGAATAVLAIGALAPGSAAWLGVAILAAGMGVMGAQFCINALAASLYPAAMRSAGVGLALSVGRLGAIVSPFVGSVVIGLGWPMRMAMAPAMVAGLVCATAVGGLALATARRTRDGAMAAAPVDGLMAGGERSGRRRRP